MNGWTTHRELMTSPFKRATEGLLHSAMGRTFLLFHYGTATSLMTWRKIGVSGTSIGVGPYNSPDELLFICRAFLTLRACSLILLACLSSAEFESQWFSFNESPLDGCLVGDDFLADPSNSEKPLTGVLPQEKENFTHRNENKNVIIKPIPKTTTWFSRPVERTSDI